MQVIVAGCGKVGSSLARHLNESGHDVVVIEENPQLLEEIDDVPCVKIIGHPIDVEVQKQAGAENADALVCVTSDENINVMAAEVAQVIHRVPKVIARTQKQTNDESFREMGLQTVCATRLVVNSLLKAIDIGGDHQSVEIFGENFLLIAEEVPEHMIGHSMAELDEWMGQAILAVIRNDDCLLARSKMKAEAGDLLIFAKKEDVEAL